MLGLAFHLRLLVSQLGQIQNPAKVCAFFVLFCFFCLLLGATQPRVQVRYRLVDEDTAAPMPDIRLSDYLAAWEDRGGRA